MESLIVNRPDGIGGFILGRMKSFRVLTAGLGVVVLWASAFPAIQLAAPGLGVIGLSFVRLIVAAGALLVVAPFFRVRWPERRQLVLLVVAAFFGMTAYQVLLNWGELAVPAGTASIIVAAAPLVSVAVATLALGERLTVAKVVGSALAISGVAWVCLARSGASASAGLWIVVGAMLVQGVYHPLTKALLRNRTGLEVATYAMVAGTVMTLPMLPWGWHDLMAGPAPAWRAAIYLGLLPSALGFVLWGYTVAGLPVTTSTSLLYLVPAVAVLIAFVWLGELPYPSELLGGLVVLAGVLVISQGDRIRQHLAGHAAAPAESDLAPSAALSQTNR